MSFRRSKDAATEKRRWKTFVGQQQDNLRAIGMPEQIYREKAQFDHWVMHGHHPLDPSGFAIEHVDATSRKILLNLLRAYLDAGFNDPGIAILSDHEKRQLLMVHRPR
jgi:hypothetical protein